MARATAIEASASAMVLVTDIGATAMPAGMATGMRIRRMTTPPAMAIAMHIRAMAIVTTATHIQAMAMPATQLTRRPITACPHYITVGPGSLARDQPQARSGLDV